MGHEIVPLISENEKVARAANWNARRPVSLRELQESVGGRIQSPPRRHGIMRGANRFSVAYVYFASEPGHTRYLMTKDEARTIAATNAKLPELLQRPQH